MIWARKTWQRWYRTDWAIGLTVFLLSLLPRVLAPAGQFSDPDAPAFWLPWIKEFADGLRTGDLAKLAPAPHPGVPFLWLTAPMELLLQKTQWHFQFANPLEAYLMFLKLPVMFATSGLVWVAWVLLKKMLSRQWAVLATLLFAIDPLYLAYSRYLHLEALLAGLIFCGLLATWIGAREQSRRYLVIGAVLLTLSALTRINGLIPFAFGLLATFVIYRGPVQALWKSIAWAAGVSLGVAVLLWPPLIFAPGAVLATQDLNLAMALSAHEVPPSVDTVQPIRALYYPLFIIIRELPIVVLLAGAGILAAVRRSSWPWRSLALYMAGFVAAYYFALLIEPKKLERYFLPAIGPMILLAGLGLERLLHWRPTVQPILRWGFGISLVLELTVLWLHAPYFQTYENVFTGWIKPTGLVRSQAMYFSWGEGINEAAVYLRAENNGQFPVVASWYAGNFCLYGREANVQTYPFHPTAGLSCPPGLRLLADADEADYIVLSRDQITQRIYPRLLDDIQRLGWAPEKIITLNGRPYLWIYQNQGGLADRYSLTGQ